MTRLRFTAVLIGALAGCHGSGSTHGTGDASDAPPDLPSDAGSPVDATADEPGDAPDAADLPDAPADLPVDLAPDTRDDASDASDASDAGDASDARETGGSDSGPSDRGPPADGAPPLSPLRWLNPLPQGNSLGGVWGSGPDDVYLVGQFGTILHSSDRGQSWQAQASGTTSDLDAVWGSGPDDVYAAGGEGTILHTDDRGATWTPMSSGTPNKVLAIWGSGPDDVYAVGAGGFVCHRVARGAWQIRILLSHSTSGIGWFGVFGSGGVVWVGGSNGYVMRSNDGGTTWNDVGVAGQSTTIRGLTGSGGKLYAALSVFNQPNVAVSTDGGDSWQLAATSTRSATSAIWAAGDTVYAAGGAGFIEASTNGGANFTDLASGGPATVFLNGVWGSGPDDVYVVGDAGIIMHRTSATGAFAQAPGVTRLSLRRVWASPAGDLVAVGYMPTIVQSSDRGAHFALRTPTGTSAPANIWAVSGAGDAIYAAGYQAIVRSDDRGVTWAQDYFNGYDMRGVVTTDSDVYAVADGSRVFHKTLPGGTWSIINVTGGGTQVMTDLVPGVGGEMWAVGGNNTLHLAAGTWTYATIPSIYTLSLSGAWVGSASTIVAVGGSGQIVVTNDGGATWSRQVAGGGADLSGACGGGGRMFAVGAGGTVLTSTDGASWTAIPKITSVMLYGCAVQDSTLYVVGGNGAILTMPF